MIDNHSGFKASAPDKKAGGNHADPPDRAQSFENISTDSAERKTYTLRETLATLNEPLGDNVEYLESNSRDSDRHCSLFSVGKQLDHCYGEWKE